MKTPIARAAAVIAWFLLLSLAAPVRTPAGENAQRALADLPIDFRAIETGRAAYDIAMHVGQIGVRGELSFTSSVTMSTTVARDQVLMEDAWEIMGRSISLRMKCARDPLLRLRETSLEVSRKGQSVAATLTVKGEQGVLSANGQTTEIPYPAGTLMQAAAFRIVPLLPRKPGVAYTFDHYTESVEVKVSDPKPGERFSLECVGLEAVSVRGDDVECTKYVLRVARPVDFYVDRDARIQMVVADGGETVMVRRPDGLLGAGAGP